ncbi:hypothetical protein J6590_055575 [Homalodisca vitripennis]|nr:hypothetical protein J6590_055575 [Homalodisca vitripennis]
MLLLRSAKSKTQRVVQRRLQESWITDFTLSLFLEVILYCRLKCELERGRDVHQYGTRGRDNFRLDQHRMTAYGRLPSQVGVRLINRLPEGIKKIKRSKSI